MFRHSYQINITFTEAAEACNFTETRVHRRCFRVIFYEVFQNSVFIEHLWTTAFELIWSQIKILNFLFALTYYSLGHFFRSRCSKIYLFIWDSFVLLVTSIQTVGSCHNAPLIKIRFAQGSPSDLASLCEFKQVILRLFPESIKLGFLMFSGEFQRDLFSKIRPNLKRNLEMILYLIYLLRTFILFPKIFVKIKCLLLSISKLS